MEDNKYHEKVLVVVKGGLVQSLYVSDKQIEIDVLDFDNEELPSHEAEEEELSKRSKGIAYKISDDSKLLQFKSEPRITAVRRLRKYFNRLIINRFFDGFFK
jgi:hypothetical protein